MLLPMLPMLPTSSHYAPHITCSALTFLADSGIAFVKVSLGPMSKGSKRTSWLSELDRVAIAAIAFELNSVRCKVPNHDVWQWLRAYWPPVGHYLLQISLSWDWARLQGLDPVLAPQFAGPLHGSAWTSPLRPHPSSHPSLLPWFCPWKPVAPTGAHLSLEMQHLHQRSKVNRATCDSDPLTYTTNTSAQNAPIHQLVSDLPLPFLSLPLCLSLSLFLSLAWRSTSSHCTPCTWPARPVQAMVQRSEQTPHPPAALSVPTRQQPSAGAIWSPCKDPPRIPWASWPSFGASCLDLRRLPCQGKMDWCRITRSCLDLGSLDAVNTGKLHC